MPATYQLDSSNALVRVTVHGDVHDDDLIQLQEAIQNAPATRSSWRVLLDCSHVHAVLATANALRELGSRSSFGANARIAIVATRDIVYLMARMAESWYRGAAAIRVFREGADAEAWLLGTSAA